MRTLGTLIALNVNGIFRFSVIRHSRNAGERRRAILGLAAIGSVVIVYGGMSGAMTAQMLINGIDVSVPFLMIALMASLFAAATAFAQGGATLCGFADYDLLTGMPISTPVIVLSRFCALYLTEAVYCFAYLLPCGAVYAILVRPEWRFYAAFPVMTLLLPIVPIVLGSAADLLLSAAFAKSRYQKGVTSAVKAMLLLGFVVFAYLLPQIGERFLRTPEKAVYIAARIFPPALWFAKGAAGDTAYAGLFALGSAAVCVLFIRILSRTFLPLHDRLEAGYRVKDYRLGALKRSSVLKALFTVERRRFFSSTAWVVNTAVGSVLIAALGVGGAAFSEKLIPLFKNPAARGYAVSAATGLLILCAAVSPTTSCALSMEGKEIWISKTLPVSAKLWLTAKLLMNLLLVGPSLLAAAVLLSASYRECLGPAGTLGLILAPTSALLFATVFGLFVNAKMPRLSWRSDTEVVKQSGAVIAMMLTGFGLAALTAVPALLTGRIWAMTVSSAAIICAAAAAYLHLMKNAEQIRRNL